jgi:hypothetical protein
MSGVLWYELFTETLEQHGFTTNPYDFCVANATVNGSQCTIGWFVDDTKISHVDPAVVTNIIGLLEARFGSMTVTRGQQHKFLGMNIKYMGDGTATIHMPSYISEAITESGLDVSKAVKTPCRCEQGRQNTMCQYTPLYRGNLPFAASVASATFPQHCS